MLPWLHPTVVHFAIALLFTAVALDVVGLWRMNERLVFAGFFNTVLGAVAALVAVATGLRAEGALGPQDPLGAALLQFHEVFAWAGTLLAVVLAGARVAMRGIVRPRTRTLYLTLALLMAALVTVGGALGGAAVYAYGVGISPEAARRVVEANKPPAPAPAPAPIAAAEPVPDPAPPPSPAPRKPKNRVK